MTCPALFLLRHGETVWNRDGRIQGQQESQLTARGQDQARRQGDILAGLDLPDDCRAYCSPLRRTRQTAALALAGTGLAPVFDARLKEVYLGDWEGHLRADLAARMPDIFAGRGVFETCLMSPGETEADLRARIGAFLADLDGPAVVVSHGIALTILCGIVLGAGVSEMEAMSREQGVVTALVDGRTVIHR